ncbi:MAG: rod shape-determining protein MreC [Pyrinomonadaceae bacterium]
MERSQKEVWRLTPWLLLGLLLINFVMMAYDARAENDERVVRVWVQAAANFVQSPVTSASTGITEYFQRVARLRSAQSENDQLRQRIHELEVEVSETKPLAAENRRLSSLLELKQTEKSKLLAARIVGRDTSAWFSTAIIDRGSLDGVKVNMPVVVDGGLVGRITAVSPLTAQIDLITHDKSGMGAIVGEIGTSEALGVVRGTGKDRLEMNYVPGYEKVNVGDPIYTTGQGNVFPSGLKVGTVVEVRSGSATVPHQIFIQPTAKITAVREVAVLLFTPENAPLYTDALPNAVPEDRMSNELKNKMQAKK